MKKGAIETTAPTAAAAALMAYTRKVEEEEVEEEEEEEEEEGRMESGRLHVGEGVAGEGGLGDDAGEGELLFF